MRTVVFVFALAIVALGVALVPGARPAEAAGLVSIAAGSEHTCALTTAGGVKCWGLGASGQLGDGSMETSLTPVDVLAAPDGPPLDGVTAVTAGSSFSCALMADSGVKCWGWNERGELGNGTQTPSSTPVDVCQVYDEDIMQCTKALSGAIAVSVGGLHTCAVMARGGVKCWGWNRNGQLGDGTRGEPFSDDPVIVLAAGHDDAAEHIRTTPVDVCQDYDEAAGACREILEGVVAVSAGSNHSCALVETTRVKCWGLNLTGQVGDGTGGTLLDPLVRTTPVDVCQAYDDAEERCTQLFAGAASVAAGASHTCATTTDDTVKCWGSTVGGGLGNGESCTAGFPAMCPTPVDVCADETCAGPLSGVAAVTTGRSHSCALMASGGVKCWGRNANRGELGDERRCPFTCETPVDVCGGGEPAPCETPLANVVTVGAQNSHHTCVVLEDGRAKCWGKGFNGQLGDGTRGASEFPACNCRTTPVSVLGIDAKPLPGDVDCSGGRTSRDSLLLLQFVAGLFAPLPCPEHADVNEDGRVTAVDAALVLQYVAGLVPTLG